MVSKTTYRDMALFPLQRIKYPYHISTVFPPPVLDSGGRLNGSRRSSVSSPRKPGDSLDSEVQMLDTLHTVDYRYSRFALDPRTGLFNMTRCFVFLFQKNLYGLQLRREWRDPSWKDLPSVHNGLH